MFLIWTLTSFFFLFWQKFLESDFLMEKLSLQAPIYIVMEGSEPTFFTRFFTWDSSKSSVSAGIKSDVICRVSDPQKILMISITDAWEFFPKKTCYSQKWGYCAVRSEFHLLYLPLFLLINFLNILVLFPFWLVILLVNVSLPVKCHVCYFCLYHPCTLKIFLNVKLFNVSKLK